MRDRDQGDTVRPRSAATLTPKGRQMRMSYDEIVRRREEQEERFWRWFSGAIGLAFAAGILVVVRRRATPFDPFRDLPPLFVATFWIVAGAATWAGWIGARVAIALRLAFRRLGPRAMARRLVIPVDRPARRRARPVRRRGSDSLTAGGPT